MQGGGVYATTHRGGKDNPIQVFKYMVNPKHHEQEPHTVRTEIIGHGAKTSKISPSGLGGKTP